VIPAFALVAFADPDAAQARLSLLIDGERPNFATHLAAALMETPDADLALLRFERFITASRTPGAELDIMNATPRYARLVLTVLGHSSFLTDIVCRNPEYMLWLWEEADLENTRPRDKILTDALHSIDTFPTFETRCDALRRLHRREILRIAARDIVAHCHVAAVADDLSNFADAVSEAALCVAELDIAPRFGAPRAQDGARDAKFVVIGMGKLGAQELNFSSDIDLIFMYSEDGETSGGTSSIGNAEYYHKLGERMIRALSEHTAEGSIFRVDMRLRPHGKNGPLAVDLDTALRYYEREGHAWERQALIKARPIAGDFALGRHFVESTRAFVYPKFFDDETLEDIRNAKRQMETQIAQRGESDIEVKLGRGGIRDIEFTVQMLQLLNGGRIPELCVAPTLPAIRVLGAQALLKPLDAQTLASNYVFLRQVEHRLQIEGSRQVHCLPSDPVELDVFARRLGYANGRSFMNDYSDRADATRKILDQFLATEGSGNLWVTDLLNSRSEGDVGKAGLLNLGFQNVDTARDELLALYTGPRERSHTLHVRQQFLKIAPALLKALSNASGPDTALRRLGQILGTVRAPSVVYDTLIMNPNLCQHLVTLVENSPYLADLMVRDPGLFDTFGNTRTLAREATREDLDDQLASLLRAYDSEAAPYRLHAGETLRIGMRDIIAGVEVEEISRELTLLAEVCLGYAIAKAREKTAERFGAAAAGFAVLALGKFAGRELGYGSDLDLVFVYESGADTGTTSPVEYFSDVASGIIRILKELTRYGMLYDVDARLRPDGSKGSLAVSDARLAEYYVSEAQAWERLALLKVRAVGGDEAFAAKVEERARRLAFELPLTRENLANIEEMRGKLVTSSARSSLKKDEGGMAEIEFAIRLLQIRYATEHPQLVRGDVMGAADTLEQIGALSGGDSAALRDAYRFFRGIENRLRVEHGRSTSRLPETTDEQAALAKRLDIQGDLVSIVNEHKTRVHAVYSRVLALLERDCR